MAERNGAEIDLLSDPFDIWLELYPTARNHSEWQEAKFGSVADAEWSARRDDWEPMNNVGDAF